MSAPQDDLVREVRRPYCHRCGQTVSNAMAPLGQQLIVRAWVECPECIERGADTAEQIAELAEMLNDELEQNCRLNARIDKALAECDRFSAPSATGLIHTDIIRRALTEETPNA